VRIGIGTADGRLKFERLDGTAPAPILIGQ
jgi:hypothetical protein